MKRGKNNKKKSPSRDRYDKENPTVSGRMPKEKRDKFYANLAKSGRSVSDALNSLADDLELKVRPIDEAMKASYEEAKNLYMVTYLCNVCGKPMTITSPTAKEAASRYMTEHGWGHIACHKQRQQP